MGQTSSSELGERGGIGTWARGGGGMSGPCIPIALDAAFEFGGYWLESGVATGREAEELGGG